MFFFFFFVLFERKGKQRDGQRKKLSGRTRSEIPFYSSFSLSSFCFFFLSPSLSLSSLFVATRLLAKSPTLPFVLCRCGQANQRASDDAEGVEAIKGRKKGTRKEGERERERETGKQRERERHLYAEKAHEDGDWHEQLLGRNAR